MKYIYITILGFFALVANADYSVLTKQGEGYAVMHYTDDGTYIYSDYYATYDEAKERIEANIKGLKNVLEANKEALEQAENALVTLEALSGECISANEGYELSLSGTYTIQDGDCNSATDTNGDTFVISGEYTVTNSSSVKIDGDVIYPKSKGWSFTISGAFTLTKQGGAYADFQINN